MDAGLIERIETGAGLGAAALFAAAVGYAAYELLVAAGFEPQLGLATAAAGAGALAYLPCSSLLRLAAGGGAGFSMPGFSVREFDFVEPDDELLLTERVAPEELVLTDDDRLHGGAPLDLDDILAEIGPDARVVRLFDRRAMPAPVTIPGQLQSRIADHLRDGATRPAPSSAPAALDASHALSAALAELRRSLR